MLPYLRFTRHLRAKYAGNSVTVPDSVELDNKTFNTELATYLHIPENEAGKAAQEMKFFGLIKKKNQSTVVYRHLLD